jgi:hypothetical protein
MRSAKEKARDAKLADMMFRAATRHFNRQMKLLHAPRNAALYEKDDAKMIRQDRNDLIHVSSLVRRGHYIEGLRFAQSMDTFPREAIPTTVWDALNKWG